MFWKWRKQRAVEAVPCPEPEPVAVPEPEEEPAPLTKREIRAILAEQETIDGTPSEVRDEDGFIYIKFQCGPVKEAGVNGTTIEDVLGIVISRLEGFQRGRYACWQNQTALDRIKNALSYLNDRTAERIAAGIEGTNKV